MTRIGNHDITIRLIITPKSKPLKKRTATDRTRWEEHRATISLTVDGTQHAEVTNAWINVEDPDEWIMTRSRFATVAGDMGDKNTHRFTKEGILHPVPRTHAPRNDRWRLFPGGEIAQGYAAQKLGIRPSYAPQPRKRREIEGQTRIDFDPSTWETAA